MSKEKPRVLVLTPRFPYPPLSGGKLVLLNVAKALKSCELTLLSLCTSPEEMEIEPGDGLFSAVHKVYLPKWRAIRSVLFALPTRKPLQLAYYESSEFRARVEELLPQNDLVISHLIRTGQYVEMSRLPSILVMSDAISLAYKRMTSHQTKSVLWHWLYRMEENRLFDYEKNVTSHFNQVWLHSDVDRRFLEMEMERVRIIPIGVDLQEFPFQSNPSGDVVAFIGNMSFSLNQDACHYFIEHIFPRLRAEGNIRFRVIGACPAPVRRKLERHDGVEVTGRVDRIAEAIDHVFCGVCPLRGGAGMQTKVLNYLALGIPCVTSEVGLGGIGAVPGSDLLVYGDANEAARFILDLHSRSALRQTLGLNGRRFVERTHDWAIIYRQIEDNVRSLVSP
jgi:glycosyltransferase involved in cell wall biosynthesis